MPDPIATGGSGATNPYWTDPASQPALTEAPDAFGKDTFLKLMVAQLKYQNPLSPMDSSEFMAQTAQFTTVEQLTELTDKLTESLANDRMGTATAMIGREVTYTGPDGQEATAAVTGVRFTAVGPTLVLADGTDLEIGGVAQVSAPSTT